ncbi:MAG: GldM family protein [Chitinophagaceae bacterium]
MENILYLGVTNNIDFASKTVPQKEIILIPQRGKIESFLGRYTYTNCTDSPGLLKIYALNRKTQKLIDSMEFRLKRLPTPYITHYAANTDYANGLYKGNNLIEDSKGLRCHTPDDFTDWPCQIKEFTITVQDSSGTTKDFKIQGNNIPLEIKQMLQAQPQQSSIVMYDFKVIQGCVDKEVIVSKTIKLR